MAGTKHRIYMIEKRGDEEAKPVLVWAQNQGAAIAAVVQDEYSIHVASPRDLCVQLAKGNCPINEAPE